MAYYANKRWIICPACGGDGTCVNPNIDANGFYPEDQDDIDAYMDGVYDIQCAACGGAGKIQPARMNQLRQNAADRRLAAMEDGDFDAYCHANDYRYG